MTECLLYACLVICLQGHYLSEDVSALTGTLEKDTALQVGFVLFYSTLNTGGKGQSKWSIIKPPSPHYLSFAKICFLLIISIHFQTCRLRESRHQSLCDASVCAFQVFDWESFPVTVRHYCLQPKNFDSNIEESIISSTSIYFSFIKDGDDDVDTPCWI